MKIRIALTAILLALSSSALISAARAQVVVSIDTGETAHACYLAAKTGINPRDGIATCTAALGDPLSAPNRAATLDNRGVLYDLVRDNASALADYNASIRVNPDLGDPYLNRGVSLIRVNRLEDALADIRKGVGLGISLPQVGYFDLAVAEERLGQFTEAYHDYKRALDADPAYAPATMALTRYTVTITPAPKS